MRQFCTGESLATAKGQLKGATFYRIIDRFIDQARATCFQWWCFELERTFPLGHQVQTGVHGASSIYGGQFKDDPGGLLLKHDRPVREMGNGKCCFTAV